MNILKIKKGDIVQIIAGKDKGRKGKVLAALPKNRLVSIEGMNIKKKHRRPRQQGQKGQIIEIPAPFDISNVQLICSKCSKPSRVGYIREEGVKIRICKKCGKET